MDLLGYVEAYGNFSFQEKPINEVDSLLFSTLCYENLDHVLLHPMTLKKASDIFFELYDIETLKKRISLTKRSYELLKEMAKWPRYQNLVLSGFVNEVDETRNVQFSVMMFQYEKQWKYIAFRGTDDTLVGWKEDFLMCCSDAVLSQKKAADYLDFVLREEGFFERTFQRIPLYVGGHSKGGNLAMYAAAFCSNKTKKRIVRVDNFDGPGFDERIWKQEGMQKICEKIHAYIPTSSVFGRLFMHEEATKILETTQIGLMQHDPFSWKIEDDHFEYACVISEGSEKALTTLNDVLMNMDMSSRSGLIEKTFKLIYDCNIHTLGDIKTIGPAQIFQAVQGLRDLDDASRKVLLQIVKAILEVTLLYDREGI